MNGFHLTCDLLLGLVAFLIRVLCFKLMRFMRDDKDGDQ